jgi:hypothetical protein
MGNSGFVSKEELQIELDAIDELPEGAVRLCAKRVLIDMVKSINFHNKREAELEKMRGRLSKRNKRLLAKCNKYGNIICGLLNRGIK